MFIKHFSCRSVTAFVVFVAMSLATPAAFAQTRYQFDVPAQPLGDTLRAVGRVTGTNVLFEPQVVAGKTAKAIAGQFTLEEALSQATSDTTLEIKRSGENTILVREKESKSEKASVEKLEQVTVTGSHIRGAAASSPMIIIDRDEIDRSGYTTIGDFVRSLPENFSGGNNPQTAVGNAPSGIGGTGAGLTRGTAPNLRGLGNGSTLTLVNGHRVAQDAASGAVDISFIPLDAVERVEIVTDGASAIYGADAVAGVVNFILKKEYNGAQTSISAGKATDGGAFDKRISQLLGKSWQGGGVVFNYEHEDQDVLDASQRSFTSSHVSPYTLLPKTSRDSFYVAGNQNLTDSVSGFIDGLYTSRSMESSSTFPPTYIYQTPVKQFGVNAGLNISLPGRWKATIVGSDAEQSSVFNETLAPSTLLLFETLRGKTRSAEVNADGSVLSAPAGLVHLALGAGYRQEIFDYGISTQAQPQASAERNVKYLFGELAVPLVSPRQSLGINRLELDIAGRSEDYSDVGSKFVPKIGFVLIPNDQVTARVSWSKSFRAPPLFDQYGIRNVYLYQNILPDPLSPSGASNVLLATGGNLLLKPETAESWTTSLDYRPDWLSALKLTASYYNIEYTNRIGQMSNVLAALTDPANAAFVSRNPSSLAQQALINNANGGFTVVGSSPYNPSNIAAIVNDSYLNLAKQRLNGLDLLADLKFKAAGGDADLFLNSSYLQFQQQVAPNVPQQQLAGKTFNPPRFRARGGLNWTNDTWSATGIVNYLGAEINTYQANLPHVSSWTTFDATLSYKASSIGVFGGFRVTLAIQNIANKNPPFVLYSQYVTGINYDSLNASPLGRFASLQLLKVW